MDKVELIASEVELFCVTDPTPESNFHMQIGILVLSYRGVPTIKQPEFCSALHFFSIENLPQPIFVGSVDVIRNYLDGKFYIGEYELLLESEM